MEFRAEMASGMESALESALESTDCIGWAEVEQFLCVSSVSADLVTCHFSKEGIQACGFDEA